MVIIINEVRQFRELIDDDPVLTGTIQAHNSDGASYVLKQCFIVYS